MTLTEMSTEPDPPPPRRRSRAGRWLRMSALIAVTVVAGLVVAQLGLRAVRPHAFAGTAFASPQPAAPLDGLYLDTGEPADLDDYRGQVVLLFFGYTWCPDVCPTTLSVAARAIERLGSDGDDVRLFMVSVDPARDPADELGRYVDHFDDDFIGLAGTADAIADVASLYGVFYELHEPDADGNYLVDHTASLMGIDRDGNLKVLWDPSVTVEDLEADLDELL